MKKITLKIAVLAVIIFFLTSNNSFGQVSGQFVEENAFEIKDRTLANDSLYEKVKGYKAIMLGELHGVKESPEFILGLVKSLQKNGKKVVVAFEIASDGLKSFEKDPTIDGLKKSVFFNTPTQDGRQCVAWAQMLVELRALNAEVIYINLNFAEKEIRNDIRDSIMYQNLNAYFKTDTTRTLVTLTGSLSNKLTPNKGVKTLAYYMQHDNNSCFKDKSILSLIHYHGKGNALYWANDGFKLREVESNADFYEFATGYENYLLIYNVQEGYNGIFYSKTLTASPSLISPDKK
ncbi:MAG: hypothetical protein ACXVC6_07505 [Bacteroidia bacterium]